MASLELLSAMQESATAAAEKENDFRSITPFLRKLPRPPEDMLRFFDRSSYYSLHGRDADTVATEYFKSSACVRYMGSGEERQAYLTFNKTMGAEIIRKALLHQRRRVEVYTSERGEWTLERRGSPGNLQAFEEECLRHSDLSVDTSSVIVAVKLSRSAAPAKGSSPGIKVGCAFVDCTVRSIRVSEFEDDENLSALESLVCQQGARECLLPAELSEPDRKRLTELAELCEVPHTSGRKGSFAAKDVEQDLRRLLAPSHELQARTTIGVNPLATACACGLVAYLDLLSNTDSHGLWSLEWVDAKHLMRLDSGAMRALSVEPQPGDTDRNASLLGLFSVCKTAMGARLVRKWLKQPLLSRHEIVERHDVVDAFVRAYETRSLLRDEVLPKMGADLDKLGRSFLAKKATLKEVVALYYFVLGLPRLHETLEGYEEAAHDEASAALIATKFTRPLQRAATNFTNLLRLVQSAVDLSAAQRHEYVLQRHFSAELQQLADQKDEVEGRIEARYEALLRQTGLERERLKLELDPKSGHCLKVTRNDEKALRGCAAVKSGKVKLNQIATKKDGATFQDTQLASLAEEYAEVAKAYGQEQRTLSAKVIATAASFSPVITETVELLGTLDALLAFAHVSASAPEPYVRPTIVPPEDPQQRIVLKGCRHPCVERMDGVGFIKNDVSLLRGTSNLHVVTGPNMGGKSTYIRSVGVNVLLAQVGCFVPCDEAEISITDSILARVGAGDCQARGVSTFMAEMLETSTILKGATAASLVIIDELGRGTSTYDGYGLAWAIAEHLATTTACCTLFATHFHELTQLADKHANVVNRHVAAHIEDGQLTMLYKVADGPCDRAFGIHVAEVAQFPPSVILAAKRKLEELEAGDLLDAQPSDAQHSDAGAKRTAAPSTSGGPARTRPSLTQTERSEGLKEVRSFLESVRSLPLDTMAAEEATAAVAALGSRLKASSNPMVHAICGQ